MGTNFVKWAAKAVVSNLVSYSIDKLALPLYPVGAGRVEVIIIKAGVSLIGWAAGTVITNMVVKEVKGLAEEMKS